MTSVVLDTSVVSALLQPRDALHSSSSSLVTDWEARGSSFFLPAVVWCEALIGVLRSPHRRERHLVNFRTQAIDEVVPADVEIATRAAHLRAGDVGIRLPDAFVVATAQQLSADVLLTGDRKLERVDPRLVQVVSPG